MIVFVVYLRCTRNLSACATFVCNEKMNVWKLDKSNCRLVYMLCDKIESGVVVK